MSARKQRGGGLGPIELWTLLEQEIRVRMAGDRSAKSIVIGNSLPEVFLDPSGSKKYVEWVVRSYLAGGIRQVEDIQSRVYPNLVKYTSLAQRKKLASDETDINKFCGLIGCTRNGVKYPGIEELIEKYSVDISDVKEDARLVPILDGEQITIYQPTTREQAIKYGKGTRWCTSASNKDNMFDDYNERGPLYIFIVKGTTAKFQLHVESCSFMDSRDEPASIGKFINDYPESKVVITDDVVDIINMGPIIFDAPPLTIRDYKDPDDQQYDGYFIQYGDIICLFDPEQLALQEYYEIVRGFKTSVLPPPTHVITDLLWALLRILPALRERPTTAYLRETLMDLLAVNGIRLDSRRAREYTYYSWVDVLKTPNVTVSVLKNTVDGETGEDMKPDKVVIFQPELEPENQYILTDKSFIPHNLSGDALIDFYQKVSAVGAACLFRDHP